MPIDYNDYPPNFKSEIIPRILLRAGNCCELCKLDNGVTVYSVQLKIQDEDGRYKKKSIWFQMIGDALRIAKYNMELIKPVKVVIAIAHLDHDEKNWQVTDDRLTAMCQLCHLNYDAAEKYRRRQTGVYSRPLNQVKKTIDTNKHHL
ncbi:hypothetical protein BDD43_3512 [Mucilaginibacter gracilis]|uniref:Uncharacterized protein n=1 Tax=Mucilaginibacter gracilis TaxID=423350 RepID=A0A495J301_9SPHI|nr:hypothetical protein [Mucilaginibacter gracilis]RKR83307.1 hypothetical protein BDD43_3512 [Mucilaginibacter gracilis]